MDRRALVTIAGLGGLLLAAVAWRMVVGGSTSDGAVLELRSLRVSVAVSVGAALAVAGVLLQALLRNPLASPDLLGLSSGAALAVMIGVYVGGIGVGGVGLAGSAVWQGLPSVVGAGGALGLVYLLSQRRGLIEPVTVVLTGVVVGIVCSAGVMLVQHLMPDAGFNSARLLIGSISDETSWGAVALVALLTAGGVALAAWAGPALDAASLGDDEAVSVGVPIARLRIGLLVVSGVLTGGAVVLAGPIGFVGLIVPHAVRLVAGPGHRGLVLGSALGGAGLIVLADAAIKAVDLGAGRMPMGIVTALVGGPVFVWLLRRGVREG